MRSPIPSARAASLGLSLALAAALLAGPVAAERALSDWVGSWASSQMIPGAHDALAPDALSGSTLRQVVHLSAGGKRLRIRLSNVFGTEPLRLVGVHAAPARPGGAIEPGGDRVVTFAGGQDVVIPAGAEIWSDPVDLAEPAGGDLAVSLLYDAAPAVETSHPGAHATSYLLKGNHLADPSLQGAKSFEHWFQLSGVDVLTQAGEPALVAFGDSITDGHGSTTDGNDRWPDDLARRLQAAGIRAGVVNAGIGGNRVLLDGLGPNAVARLYRDVLGQTGARTVIVMEGINDLGNLTRYAPASPQAHASMVREILAEYAQIVELGHAHRIRVLGATLTPDGGSGFYHPDAANEADRAAVNAWIRAAGHFDGVVDFDKAVRDPTHPDWLNPAFDSSDHLHPSPAGYRAMADAVPLPSLGLSHGAR